MIASFPWIGWAIGVGVMLLIGAATSRLGRAARTFFIAGIVYILLGLLISGSAGASDQRTGKILVIAGLCQLVLAFVPSQRWVTILRVVLMVVPLVACMR